MFRTFLDRVVARPARVRGAGGLAVAVVAPAVLLLAPGAAVAGTASPATTVTPGPVDVSYPGDGSGVQLQVAATKGQRVTLGVVSSHLTSTIEDPAEVQVTFVPPGASSAFPSVYIPETGYSESETTAGSDGFWTVQLDPQYDTSGTQTLRIGVTGDATGTATLGKPVTFSVNTPGQNVDYTFAGTAGQTVEALAGASSLTAGGDGGLAAAVGYRVTLLDPQGQNLGNLFEVTETYGETKLPATGTYTLVVDPNQDTVGSGTVTFKLAKVTTAKLAAGTSTKVTIKAGDVAHYTFTAVPGRRFAAYLTTVSPSPKGATARADLILYRPDGTEFARGPSDVAELYFETDPLDAAGTWTFAIDPVSGDAGTFTFVARQPKDVTGSLTAGKSLTTTVSQPGQNARYTFHGVAGTFPVIDATKTRWRTPDGVQWNPVFRLIAPDGTDYAYFGDPNPYPKPTSTSTRRTLETNPPLEDDGSLAVTGTWTLLIDPPSKATGAETYTLKLLTSQS